MDVYEAIMKRKSVRSFFRKDVEKEKVLRIINAAMLAPSASNRQEWRFLVVCDSEIKKQLAYESSSQEFISEAPIIIACCAESDGHIMRCGIPSYIIDVAIAVDHITLAAVGEGLGTCWIGSFDENVAKRILKIPERIILVQLLALGYPSNPEAVKKQRLPIDKILHYNAWQRKDT